MIVVESHLYDQAFSSLDCVVCGRLDTTMSFEDSSLRT